MQQTKSSRLTDQVELPTSSTFRSTSRAILKAATRSFNNLMSEYSNEFERDEESMPVPLDADDKRRQRELDSVVEKKLERAQFDPEFVVADRPFEF